MSSQYNKLSKALSIALIMIFISVTALEMQAFARAGGGRSFGSRGSRSYSSPTRSYSSQPSSPSPQQPSSPASPSPSQNPSGGGFMRGIGGGILGGIMGGMLFRSLGFGSGFGGLGGGIGLFDILLLFGIGYMVFRMVKKRRAPQVRRDSTYQDPSLQSAENTSSDRNMPYGSNLDSGIAGIRQMDPLFEESHFKEGVTDSFFKVQSAWMNRDLASVHSLLTEEMRNVLQEDINGLLRENKTNKLENVAMRTVEMIEAWQESGQDFITVLFTANLLDYTVDDSTGALIFGSRTEPVKFREYWTFTRPVGNNPWKLTAISQES